MTTGPEIRGCRPILVTFNNFKVKNLFLFVFKFNTTLSLKDREEVLSKSKLLKTANIYVSEDLSRKTREHRNELFKYMRFVKRRAPNRKCVIRYDKLFVDKEKAPPCTTGSTPDAADATVLGHSWYSPRSEHSMAAAIKHQIYLVG